MTKEYSACWDDTCEIVISYLNGNREVNLDDLLRLVLPPDMLRLYGPTQAAQWIIRVLFNPYFVRERLHFKYNEKNLQELYKFARGVISEAPILVGQGPLTSGVLTPG